MKKAFSRHLTLFGVFFLVIAFSITLIANLLTFSAAQGSSAKGQEGISDANLALQGVKQSFEKSALFFGLMNTTKELGAHGGINNPEDISGETPSMLTALNTLFYGVIECNPTCRITKKMPFVAYVDADAPLYTELDKYTMPIVLGPDMERKNYGENLEDVAAGKYKFNVMVQAIFLKPGTVKFKACQENRCTSDTTLPETGSATIQIGNDVVQNKNANVLLHVWANAKDVAVLRQVTVSIYDSGVVSNPNQLLTQNLNNYRMNAASLPSDTVTDSLKSTSIYASFVPAGTGLYNTLEKRRGFARGIAWWPDKVSATSSGNKVIGWSIAEADLQAEYWRNYRASEYFIDIVDIPNLIMPRLLQATENVMSDDFCYPERVVSTGGGTTPPTFSAGNFACPDAFCPNPYSSDEFRQALNTGLKTLADELDDLCGGVRISWKLSIPDGVLTPGDYTNPLYSSLPNKWTESWTKSCNCETCCETSGDPPVESCWTCNCETCYYLDYHCKVAYAHQYTSNNRNLKILVEMTPQNYTVFDFDEKNWVYPTYKFFVEFYPVDDNYCDGYVCSSIGGAMEPMWVSAPALPPSVSPLLPPNDLLEDGMYLCAHNRKACTDLGGTVVIDTEDGKTRFCKVPGSSCPPDWTQYLSWSATSKVSCAGSCGDDFSLGCTTGQHIWSNTPAETCVYFRPNPKGNTFACINPICSALITEIGCY